MWHGSHWRTQAPAGRMGVFGFVYFIMPNTVCEAIIFFAVILSLAPQDMLYGSQAALILPRACPQRRLAIGSHPSAPEARHR